MNEWEVVGVLAALAALISGIAAPMLKLNASIVRLDTTMKSSTKELDKIESENHSAHKHIYSRLSRAENDLAEHKTTLKGHEDRLNKLENKE